MPEKRTEVLARRMVEAHLRVQLTIADFNSGHAVHDYDVPLGDGTIGALEVFVAANEADVQRSAAHARYGSDLYRSSRLRRSWVVSLGEDARFKHWGPRVEAFLVEVEARGLTDLAIEDCYGDPELLTTGRELGFEIGHAFDCESYESAMISITTGFGGIAGGPNDAVPVLQTLLSETRDARDKLAASGRLVREAFVLVDSSLFSLWSPLEEGLPSVPLSLPPELTGA